MKGFGKVKTMKKAIMMLGMALAWAIGGFADTHEAVQLRCGILPRQTRGGAPIPSRCGKAGTALLQGRSALATSYLARWILQLLNSFLPTPQ